MYELKKLEAEKLRQKQLAELRNQIVNYLVEIGYDEFIIDFSEIDGEFPKQDVSEFPINMISEKWLGEIKGKINKDANLTLPHGRDQIEAIIDGELYRHYEVNNALGVQKTFCFYYVSQSIEVKTKIENSAWIDFIRSSYAVDFNPLPFIRKSISQVKFGFEKTGEIWIMDYFRHEPLKY